MSTEPVELFHENGAEDEERERCVPESELALSARLGALLFASTRPLSIETLAEAVSAEAGAVETAIESLKLVLSGDELGFSLIEVSGGYQLRSDPRAAKTVQKLIGPKGKRLSRAAAETLAVVAYKQPVQRSEIEAIRGVDALPTIKTLLDAKLIRIVGRGDAVGQPTLYGTTESFLERFGLRDLAELPPVREIEQLVEEPGEGLSD